METYIVILYIFVLFWIEFLWRMMRDPCPSMHPLKTLKLPQDVEEIYCGQAMAALRKDGSVITWGHSSFGGDSRAVQA